MVGNAEKDSAMLKKILDMYAKNRSCSPMMLLFISHHLSCWFTAIEDCGGAGVWMHKFDFVTGVTQSVMDHPYVLGLVGADEGKVGHWVALPDEL